MNWRGRISVVLGVLVMVGMPMWYLRPHWIYRSTTELNLDTAHVRQTHYVLNVPVWWWPRPTFLTPETEPLEDGSESRWILVDVYRLGHSHHSGGTVLARIDSIEAELRRIDGIEQQAEAREKLRTAVRRNLLRALREKRLVDAVIRFDLISHFLSRYRPGQVVPSEFSIGRHSSWRPHPPTELPDAEDFIIRSLSRQEQTIRGGTPKVFDPRKPVANPETALPEVPDDPLPELPERPKFSPARRP
ncbi:MAG: hypothetical protein AAGK14_12475 [Verrucomicrobiota bacterium]